MSNNILNWFHRTLGVDAQPSRNEVNTTCPICGSDKFYFNIVKKVGICHRASCDYRPNLDDLIEIVGFGPESDEQWDREEKEEKEPIVTLAGNPVLMMISGELMTTNEYALDYLRGRGLTDEVILNWRLTCDEERIYIPIYSNGNLVNYNSRTLPGVPGPKYLYCKGSKTSKYILGWEECSDWNKLALVENTFVSLWLRYELQCSTTFGSNISDMQANLIEGSKIKTVALLWDQNAEIKAEGAIGKLHDRGINASYWKILGQPDDYPKEVVQGWANRVFEIAKEGKPYLDLIKECEYEINLFNRIS